MRWPTRYEHSTAIREARAARDLRDRIRPGNTFSHTNGNCGGMADLCGECHREEYEAMREWATTAPPPLPGEDASAYWHRIDGRFYDNWYTVARERIKAAYATEGN
jgi:hypothetical protein